MTCEKIHHSLTLSLVNIEIISKEQRVYQTALNHSVAENQTRMPSCTRMNTSYTSTATNLKTTEKNKKQKNKTLPRL